MFNTRITCDRCRMVFLPGLYNTEGFVACPNCLSPVRIRVFPAFYRPVDVEPAAPRLMDQEASCFYHADKQAVLPCDGCGRFLCALCDMEFSGQHLCPACLERRKRGGQEKKLEARFIQYDQIALQLVLLPLLFMPFWFVTVVSAPAALYLVIRHWRTPMSVLPRSRARLGVAGLVAIAELIGWVILGGIFLRKIL